MTYRKNIIDLGKSNCNTNTIKLSSTKSLAVSLEKIRLGNAGLSRHRQSLLNRVQEPNAWSFVRKGSISMKDIAFLTAKTGDEFAILTGKKEDILFHGIKNHCIFDEVLCEMLLKGQLELYGHSHPVEAFPIPSRDDRETLKLLGQKKSRLISAVSGREIEFLNNEFEGIENDKMIEGSEFGNVDL